MSLLPTPLPTPFPSSLPSTLCLFFIHPVSPIFASFYAYSLCLFPLSLAFLPRICLFSPYLSLSSHLRLFSLAHVHPLHIFLSHYLSLSSFPPSHLFIHLSISFLSFFFHSFPFIYPLFSLPFSICLRKLIILCSLFK